MYAPVRRHVDKFGLDNTPYPKKKKTVFSVQYTAFEGFVIVIKMSLHLKIVSSREWDKLQAMLGTNYTCTLRGKNNEWIKVSATKIAVFNNYLIKEIIYFQSQFENTWTIYNLKMFVALSTI